MKSTLQHPKVNCCLPFLFVFLWFCGLRCVAQEFENGLPDLLEQVMPDAVVITTLDSNFEAISEGSGFFLDQHQVITCFHVIEEGDYIAVQTRTDSIYFVDSVVSIDFEADLAKLWVDPIDESHVGLRLASQFPKQGETIIVVGNPLGFSGSISDGLVAAVRELSGFGRIIQLTAPISPGSSGSPVINLQGEVVGVACITMIEGQGVNFAVPFDRVKDIDLNFYRQLAATPDMLPQPPQNEPSIAQAEALMDRGDFSRSLNIWTELAELYPDDRYIVFNQGFCLLKLGTYNQAIRKFKTANTLQETPAARFNLSLSYLGLADTLSAIKEAQRAVDLGCVDSSCLIMLGELLYYNQDYATALPVLNRFENTCGGTSYSEAMICDCLFFLEHYSEAASCLESYLAKMPQSKIARGHYAWSLRALGEYQAALRQYEFCNANQAGTYDIHWGMAECYLTLGDTLQSLQHYRMAVSLDNSVATLHNDYGTLLQGIGSLSDALIEYQTAVKLDSTDWMYHWNLGNLYLMLGRYPEADTSLQRAKLLKRKK